MYEEAPAKSNCLTECVHTDMQWVPCLRGIPATLLTALLPTTHGLLRALKKRVFSNQDCCPSQNAGQISFTRMIVRELEWGPPLRL